MIEDAFNALHVAILIRFLFYFRIFFPPEELPALLQFMTKLRTRSDTLRRAVQLGINGFLIIKHGDFEHFRYMNLYFTPDNLRPVAVDVLRVIYEGTVA